MWLLYFYIVYRIFLITWTISITTVSTPKNPRFDYFIVNRLFSSNHRWIMLTLTSLSEFLNTFKIRTDCFRELKWPESWNFALKFLNKDVKDKDFQWPLIFQSYKWVVKKMDGFVAVYRTTRVNIIRFLSWLVSGFVMVLRESLLVLLSLGIGYSWFYQHL